MSQPIDAKYQSKELNLYSNDGKSKYTFSDGTGLVPGLSSAVPILKLEGDVSAAGYKGNVAIPNLLYKIHASTSYAYLSYALFALETTGTTLTNGLAQELKDRQSADDVLTTGLAAEVKARGDKDIVHTNAIAQEIFDRSAAVQANLVLITNEVADRKAAITIVSNSASGNALAITAEQKAREAKDVLLDTAIDDERKRAENMESILGADLSQEVGDRTSQFNALDGGLTAEVKRATEKEAKLDARIDFITSNANPAAIDSISELLSQFTSNGMGYADRLTYLEGAIEGLVNK